MHKSIYQSTCVQPACSFFLLSSTASYSCVFWQQGSPPLSEYKGSVGRIDVDGGIEPLSFDQLAGWTKKWLMYVQPYIIPLKLIASSDIKWWSKSFNISYTCFSAALSPPEPPKIHKSDGISQLPAGRGQGLDIAHCATQQRAECNLTPEWRNRHTSLYIVPMGNMHMIHMDCLVLR